MEMSLVNENDNNNNNDCSKIKIASLNEKEEIVEVCSNNNEDRISGSIFPYIFPVEKIITR